MIEHHEQSILLMDGILVQPMNIINAITFYEKDKAAKDTDSVFTRNTTNIHI